MLTWLKRILGIADLQIQVSMLAAQVREMEQALNGLGVAQRTASTPPGLVQPRPRYMPEDLPKEVSDLVDWERLGIDLDREDA